jgi:hypothetical protein
LTGRRVDWRSFMSSDSNSLLSELSDKLLSSSEFQQITTQTEWVAAKSLIDKEKEPDENS